MNKRDLLARRAAALDAAEALVKTAEAETRDLSDADRPAYEARMAEVARIDREIEIAEQREARDRGAEAGRANSGESAAARAVAELRSLMRGEVRTMSAGTDADGGFAVPEQIDRMVANQLVEISPMRRVASIVNTGTSDYKKLVNVRGTTSGWAGEADDRTATATPQLAQIAPPNGELYAYASTTNQLLEDAMFSPEAFLRENVLDEFALQEGTAFLIGNGTDKPKGLLTYTTAATADAARAFGTMEHIAAASATAVSPDELLTLLYTLRPSYRQGAGVGWMMNSATVAHVRKLKDANGRFLWTDNLTAGQPATLIGYPVIEAEDMPDLGASALAIAFGNFRRGYLITDRRGVTMIRDNVTKPGWTKFYFSKRTGGALVDSNAVKFLKMAAA